MTPLPIDGSVNAVTWRGDRWIAVGSACPAGATECEGVPAAWWSLDGRTWTKAGEVPVAPTTSGRITTVTSRGSVLYAAGTVGSIAAMVWRSSDGDRWEVIGSGARFDMGFCFEGCPSVHEIAALDTGIVVVGSRVVKVAGQYASRPAIWSTSDGTAWIRLDESKLGLPADAEVSLNSVAAGDPGFVIVGTKRSSGRATESAIAFVSTDGRSWSAAGPLPGAAGVAAERVVAAPTGLVVLGEQCAADGSCATITWRSADAVRWERQPLDATTVAHGLRTPLAVAGDTVAILGAADGQVVTWTSTSGGPWVDQPASAAFPAASDVFFSDLAGADGALLAVGDDQGTGVREAWLSPATQ